MLQNLQNQTTMIQWCVLNFSSKTCQYCKINIISIKSNDKLMNALYASKKPTWYLRSNMNSCLFHEVLDYQIRVEVKALQTC